MTEPKAEKSKAKKPAAKKVPAFQARVIEEEKELASKIEALNTFLESKKAKDMPDSETNILNTQYNAMYSYLQILRIRIKRF